MNNEIGKNRVVEKMYFVPKTKTIGDFGGPCLATEIKIARGPNTIVASTAEKIANIGSNS